MHVWLVSQEKQQQQQQQPKTEIYTKQLRRRTKNTTKRDWLCDQRVVFEFTLELFPARCEQIKSRERKKRNKKKKNQNIRTPSTLQVTKAPISVFISKLKSKVKLILQSRKSKRAYNQYVYKWSDRQIQRTKKTNWWKKGAPFIWIVWKVGLLANSWHIDPRFGKCFGPKKMHGAAQNQRMITDGDVNSFGYLSRVR